MGFSKRACLKKYTSRSVRVSLFFQLLCSSLCLKPLCDVISLLQAQFKTTQTELHPDGNELSLSHLLLLKHQHIRAAGNTGHKGGFKVSSPATAGWAAAELSYEVLGLQKNTGTATSNIQSSLNPTAFLSPLSYLIIPELFQRNKPCGTETYSITGGLILNKRAKTLFLRTLSANKAPHAAPIPFAPHGRAGRAAAEKAVLSGGECSKRRAGAR